MEKSRLERIGTFAGICSTLLAATGLFFSASTVKTASLDQAHRSSTVLLQDYYQLKRNNDPDSLYTPFSNQLDAFHVLFLAESIFVMNKVTPSDSAWMQTVEFLVKDALIICPDKIPWDTYQEGFKNIVDAAYTESIYNNDNVVVRSCDSGNQESPE
jgi:hypothetical protein